MFSWDDASTAEMFSTGEKFWLRINKLSDILVFVD